MFNCKNIPEFSQRNYSIAGYIIAIAITCAAIYFIYQLLFNSDISFSANWNMFDSIFMWPLYIIGLVVMFANWNLFSFSYDTYDKITYGDGRVEVRRNWDIIEWLTGHVLIPILARFFLVPIIVAAIIYYPLMCIVHLVGAIFPYILTLIVIGITIVSWRFTSLFNFRYHSTILVFAGLFFTAAFSWAGYYISHIENVTNITIIQNKNGGEPPQKPEPPVTNDNPNDNPDNNNSDNPGGNADSNPDDNPDNNDGDFDDEFDDDDFGKPDNKTGDQPVIIHDKEIIYRETPCDGLYNKLPRETVEYEGDIAGHSILFTITKHETGKLEGIFIDVSSGTKLQLRGESLSDCDIKFYGKADDEEWTFHLSGTPDDIFGTAQINDGKKRGLTLYKKGTFDDEFD